MFCVGVFFFHLFCSKLFRWLKINKLCTNGKETCCLVDGSFVVENATWQNSIYSEKPVYIPVNGAAFVKKCSC